MMEDDQQFCLRWNNHQSTLLGVIDALLENGNLVDCTLAAEGRTMKAHKVVLSACSPYFATLLQEQYDKHPIFILKDVKFQELRAMMDYMYRGEVNISQDQLAALLKAAESLQIKGLSDNREPSNVQQNSAGIGVGGSQSSAPSGLPTMPTEQQLHQAQMQQQQQQQHQQQQSHHRAPNVPGGSKLSGGYTLEAQSKRSRIGPGQMDTQDMSASREGSSSPTRRRRKARRRSIENAMADPHDNSNSSQQQQQQQSSLLQSNVNLAVAAMAASQLPTGVGSVATQIAAAQKQQQQQQQQGQQMTTNVTKKTENVKGTTSDAMNTENVQVSATASGGDNDGIEQQQQAHAKIDKQNHKQQKLVAKDGTELVIEPKSEYDEEGNDETCEDLTLEDEDMGMEDLDQNAGTSQGGEGSSQGYAWPHERSQDDLLLSTQEAQQRDPQELLKPLPPLLPIPPHLVQLPQLLSPQQTETKAKNRKKSKRIAKNSSGPGSATTSAPRARAAASTVTPSSSNVLSRNRRKARSSVTVNNSNTATTAVANSSEFVCSNCGRVYQRRQTLNRHLNTECNQPRRFVCNVCGRGFHHNFKLTEHLMRLHSICHGSS